MLGPPQMVPLGQLQTYRQGPGALVFQMTGLGPDGVGRPLFTCLLGLPPWKR